MQGGNENENNDDVNDANVYVQFVCRLFKCAIAGEKSSAFLLDWSVIND